MNEISLSLTGAERDIPIKVDGGDISVRSSGAGYNTILLVHGWTLDRRVWEPQHAGLSDCARVLSFDRRGFGQASPPAGISREPSDLVEILDALELSSVWLVGQSQGARVALAFALAFPGRVAGLILQGPPLVEPLPDLPEEEVPYSRFRELAAAGDIAKVKQQWLAHPLMRSVDGALDSRLREIVAVYDGADLLNADPGLPIDAALLPTLLCPVLIVNGAKETAARKAAAEQLASRLPVAELREIPGSSHLCNLERPQAFNDAVRSFVGG